MSYTYASRKKGHAVPGQSEPSASAAGRAPQRRVPMPALRDHMSALQNGEAVPTAADKGHRIELRDAMREKMEKSFGADFSNVKLYESQRVADAGANAVARGNEIAFAPGKTDFASQSGQALLGHELSHVALQARGEVTGGGFLSDSGLEARADREGAMAARGQQVYAGAPLSSASAAPMAGPMQASKGKSKEEMMKEGFNPYADTRDVRRETGIQKNGQQANLGSGPSAMAFEATFGSEEDRRTTTFNPREDDEMNDLAEVKPDAFYSREGKEQRGKEAVENRDNRNISGFTYTPKQKGNGKHVIVYSGSGGSNQDQMKEQIKTYLRQGYTVHAYDYAGFGKSNSGADKKFSEKTVMEDADAMLDHVKNYSQRNPENKKEFQKIDNENIILHGFSLGGAISSHVARNATLEAMKNNGGQLQDKDKFSSLVLESALRNTKHTAKHSSPGLWMFGGGEIADNQGTFDTSKNLRELAKLDPDLPVNVISGTKHTDKNYIENKVNTEMDELREARVETTDGVEWTQEEKEDYIKKEKPNRIAKYENSLSDHLSNNTTKLDQLAKENFRNVASNQLANTGHMDGSKLARSWEVIKNNLSRKP